MAHGDARKGKFRGNWRMEWVVSTLTLMRTPRLPVVDGTDAPADLNGLVLFAERPNLVSARVPSHFKRYLSHTGYVDCLLAGSGCSILIPLASSQRNLHDLPSAVYRVLDS
jgi:hypothetical protein